MTDSVDCGHTRTTTAFDHVRALVPESYAATGAGEHTTSRTECLAFTRPNAQLSLRVRFLQAQHRTLYSSARDGYHAVSVLTVGGRDLVPWDEAVEQERAFSLPLAELLSGERVLPIDVSSGQDVERVSGGRVVRTRHLLAARLSCRAERLPEPSDVSGMRDGWSLVRVSVRLTNTCPVDCATFDRPQALRHSLIAAHMVLTLVGGEFLSMTDPPTWAAEHARHCVNEHVWPVLIGPDGARDTVLSSPIVLAGYPQVDPRGEGDVYGSHGSRDSRGSHDPRKTDELLLMPRTLTLTDARKWEVSVGPGRRRQPPVRG